MIENLTTLGLQDWRLNPIPTLAALWPAEARHLCHVYSRVDTIDSSHGPPVFPVYYV